MTILDSQKARPKTARQGNESINHHSTASPATRKTLGKKDVTAGAVVPEFSDKDAEIEHLRMQLAIYKQ